MNLVNILKHVEKNTILYSVVYGYVKFERIEPFIPTYPISINVTVHDDDDISKYKVYLTSDGKLFQNKDSECILFPSKEQRDWELFIKENNIEID